MPAEEATVGDALWAAGEAYEPYVGRWSRLVAAEFVARLGVPPGARWLDLPAGPDGAIRLSARAWVVRGAA